MLEEEIKAMDALTEDDDYEVAHSMADDILCQVLKTIADKAGCEKEVSDLLNAYYNVGKCYA